MADVGASPRGQGIYSNLMLSANPIWTGNHTYSPLTGPAITVNAAAGQFGIQVSGSAVSGQSFGILITAGTTSADNALQVRNQIGNNLFVVRGDGLVTNFEPSFSAAAIKNTATYDSGVFTATLATGFASAPTGSVSWYRVGNNMTLTATAAISGTSNLSSMTLTGLPTVCQPAANRWPMCLTLDAGDVCATAALIQTGSTGILFYLGATAVLTSTVLNMTSTGYNVTGTKGLPAGWTVTYSLV